MDRTRRDINRNRDELRRVENDIRKEENQRLRMKDDISSAKRHLDKVVQEIRSLEMTARNYQDWTNTFYEYLWSLRLSSFQNWYDMDNCMIGFYH